MRAAACRLPNLLLYCVGQAQQQEKRKRRLLVPASGLRILWRSPLFKRLTVR